MYKIDASLRKFLQNNCRTYESSLFLHVSKCCVESLENSLNIINYRQSSLRIRFLIYSASILFSKYRRLFVEIFGEEVPKHLSRTIFLLFVNAIDQIFLIRSSCN